MKSPDLQRAIHFAIEHGLDAVGSKVFYFHSERKCYYPRKGCLKADYSSGEAVVCAILLQFYFELNGTHFDIDPPRKRTWENSVVDVIWPRAYYFMSACNRLTHTGSWDSIMRLLPGSKEEIRSYMD